MSRDLHSAIVFCAFLSSQARANNQLQSTVCSYARPTLSTLFGTKNNQRKEKNKRLFRPEKTTGQQKFELRFFDPSFLPRDFRLKHAMKSLKRAANNSSDTLSILTLPSSKAHRFSHHRNLNRKGVPIKVHATRALIENLSRNRSISTEVADRRPPHFDISLATSQETEDDDPLLLARRRFQDALALQLHSFGRTGITPTYQPYIDAILDYCSQVSISEEPMSLKKRLRLCNTLLLVAFHQYHLASCKTPESGDNASESRPHSTTWILDQARLVWNTIDPSEIREDEGHDVQYWAAKAQLDAFDGRIEDAEQSVERFMKGKKGIGLSWMALQSYRTIFQIKLRNEGLFSALNLLLGKWEDLSPSLLGTLGIETRHTTREYAELLQDAVFDAFDKEEDALGLRTPLTNISAEASANSSWSEETRHHLTTLLLEYVITRLQGIRSINSTTPARSDLHNMITGIVDAMDTSEYSDGLAIKFSRELSRSGYVELAEKVLDRISLPRHQPPIPASSFEARASSDSHHSLEAYRISASLKAAATKGDILDANRLFTSLSRLNAVQKRDVRQLILAYTRAPIYEIGRSTLAEYESFSHGSTMERLSKEPDFDGIPDRIEDAEEIFNRLMAPQGPSVADYSVILYAHARRGNVEKVDAWIGRMLDDGIPSQDIPWELALKAFAVNGNANAVARVMDHMKQIHLRQHAKNDEDDNALPSFMNLSIFNILMELMAKRRDSWNARRLWNNGVILGGIRPNFNTITKLMRAYAEAGDWKGVIQTWDYLQSRATRQWLQAGRVGQVNNASVYNIVLRAYVAVGTPFHLVLKLFRQMKTDPGLGAEPDSFTYTMMIISASDGNNMSEALRLFGEMEEMERRRSLPKSVHAEWIEGADGVQESTSRRSIDYRPIYALTYILAGFLRQGEWERAKSVYNEIKERGLNLLPFTYALIIKSYTTAAGKDLEESGLEVAEHFLRFITGHGNALGRSRLEKNSRRRNVDVVHAPLLSAYVRRKDRHQVEKLFDQMSTVGGDASIVSLTTLMDVYRRVGDVEAVRATWVQILNLAEEALEHEDLAARQLADLGERQDELSTVSSSRTILCYPLSIYMDALSANGHHAEIVIEWQKLRESGFAFDAHNWNHLVVVLVRAGEVEKAFDVVENVILAYAAINTRITTLRATRSSAVVDDTEHGEPEESLNPLHWGRRLDVLAANAGIEQLTQIETPTDQSQRVTSSQDEYVHDLHALHHINRTWKLWKPHRRVLTMLNRVLVQMERGRPVIPLGVSESEAGSLPSASEVSASLSRILNRYPTTARLAYGMS